MGRYGRVDLILYSYAVFESSICIINIERGCVKMNPNSPQSSILQPNTVQDLQEKSRVLNNVIATCIAKISSRYFLLVENEINLTGIAIRPVVAIRLNDDQARKLLDAGAEHCDITDSIPNSKSGLTADFKGVLPIDNFTFLVFDTIMGLLDQKHHIILVNAPLCPIVDETA
jgi:hypothetical protein